MENNKNSRKIEARERVISVHLGIGTRQSVGKRYWTWASSLDKLYDRGYNEENIEQARNIDNK